MTQKFNFLYTLVLLAFASCEPKPIDIEVPQEPDKITVSSAMLDGDMVSIAAAYSANSLVNLEDSLESRGERGVPKGMMVDSATVTIAEAGQAPVALRNLANGVYGSRDIQLKEGTEYTLSVADHRKGMVVTSTSVFTGSPVVESLSPAFVKKGNDTAVFLNLRLADVKDDDYYFVCYNTAEEIKSKILPGSYDVTSLRVFEPKRLELLQGTGAQAGKIEKQYELRVKTTDTVMVTVGKIDKAYFKYLDAYKRTGYLINQLTGEPINLPTNIKNGFGYFSLFIPERRVFNLNEY